MKTIEQLKKDPSVSYWLKDALTALEKRDVLDAANDAEILFNVMKARWTQVTGQPYHV